MARYKKNEFSQNLLIPISLQEQIMPGSLEEAIQGKRQVNPTLKKAFGFSAIKMGI